MAYAEAWEKVFLEGVSSSWIEQRALPEVAGSIPARHHWIAQMGRASDVNSDGRGFDSRSNARKGT